MFELEPRCLERLTASNAFDLGDAPCVLFGLRGCLPVEEQDLTPLPKETFEPCALDWFHPRCALGLWDRTNALLAATAGSTVPNRNAVDGSHCRRGVSGAWRAPTSLSRHWSRSLRARI